MDVFVLAALNLLALLWVTGVDGDVFVKDLHTNHTIGKYPDLQASFGVDFPPDGLEGWLVYANGDHKACKPVQPPPKNSTWCADFNCNFILLIARGGDCEFSDKVLAAQKAGYDSAIVHNFPSNSSQVEMESCTNGSLVHIPATFVGYSSGMELWGYNYTHQRYIIRIWEEDDDDNFPKFLWPFLLAMTVCILVALVVLLVKLLREQASKKVNRLSKKHLNKIPVRKFKKGDYYDTCAICLDEYEEGEKIRVLPCDHVYHMKCIDPWLTKNKKTCPVCKRRVIPDRGADSESESEAENSPGSENTPLLTGQTRGQSHGSVTESAVVLNPAGSDPHATGQDADRLAVAGDRALLQDSDIEHGAVGGEDISTKNPRQETLLTLARPGRGNIQETEEESDPNNERKRKRRDWLRNGGEEEGSRSSLLVAENRVDRREKRKQRKDKKKKAENKRKCDETGVKTGHKNGVVEQADASDISATDVAGVSQVRSYGEDAQLRSYEGDEQMNHEEGGQDNPNYTDSPEVVVAAVSARRDWSDVV